MCPFLTCFLHHHSQHSHITVFLMALKSCVKCSHLRSLLTCMETSPERVCHGCFPHTWHSAWHQGAFGKSLSVEDLQNLKLPLGGNLFSFCSVDGNYFQHPAGDRDPYGILRLQAHSAPVMAKPALPRASGSRISHVAHGSVEKVESELNCLETIIGLDSW